MPKYVNRIAQSIVLKVYTDKEHPRVKVFCKTEDREDGQVETRLSKQEIAEFLNQFANKGKHQISISKNVEQGIIKDIEGIRRENGRYVYKAPDLLAEEQYNKLFESEKAIQFNLNTFMSDSISKIVQLKDRFEEILDFDPKKGLCHSLSYFITFVKLENRQDFVAFLESDNIISEQDFMNYIDGKKEQTKKLLMMQFLSQFLPILDVQSIEKREGDQFYYDNIIYKELNNNLSSTELWIYTNQEQIKCALNNVGIGCYLEFSYFCYTCNEEDVIEDEGHSMLVYKAENDKYIFFDPNKGAVGFCPNTGVANFTLEEVCKAMELAVNHYSYDMYVENFADYCEVHIGLRNATLISRKAEKLYETTERTNSKIIDISVDNYYSDAIIIAAGAQAKWLDLESEKKFQGYGVSACATCDGAFFKNKVLAVIGGGNTAVEEAIFLTRFAKEVILIHRRNSLRAEKVMQDRLFKNDKIKIMWNHTVEQILGEENPKKVTGVTIKSTETNKVQELKVDGVFIAIGHAPNTGIFKGFVEMDQQGYIITKPGTTLTSRAGVFAAGDVQDKVYRQAVVAAGTGCMAALDAEKFLES